MHRPFVLLGHIYLACRELLMSRVSEMYLVGCSAADVLMQRFPFDARAQPLFPESSCDVLSLCVNISLLLLFITLLLFVTSLLLVVFCLLDLCFLILFLCLFSILFSILCSSRFGIVLCILSPLAYSCLFAIFAQVYRPLPPGGDPTAVTKYHISCLSHVYTDNVAFCTVRLRTR